VGKSKTLWPETKLVPVLSVSGIIEYNISKNEYMCMSQALGWREQHLGVTERRCLVNVILLLYDKPERAWALLCSLDFPPHAAAAAEKSGSRSRPLLCFWRQLLLNSRAWGADRWAPGASNQTQTLALSWFTLPTLLQYTCMYKETKRETTQSQRDTDSGRQS